MKALPIDQDRRLRDLFGLAHAAQGNARDDACGLQRRAHLGVDRPGRDGVDGDAVFGDARRIASRQALQAGLRCVVGDADGAGASRRDRGDVDDPSPMARPHGGQDRLGAEEGRLQIRRERAIERLLAGVLERDARVVDQDVDRAELAYGALRELRDVRADGHVGADGDRPPANRADLPDDGVSLVRARPEIHGDSGAALGQRQRDRPADAARRARDQSVPS